MTVTESTPPYLRKIIDGPARAVAAMAKLDALKKANRLARYGFEKRDAKRL